MAGEDGQGGGGKRPRREYRKFLEPDQPFIIPRTTRNRWEQQDIERDVEADQAAPIHDLEAADDTVTLPAVHVEALPCQEDEPHSTIERAAHHPAVSDPPLDQLEDRAHYEQVDEMCDVHVHCSDTSSCSAMSDQDVGDDDTISIPHSSSRSLILGASQVESCDESREGESSDLSDCDTSSSTSNELPDPDDVEHNDAMPNAEQPDVRDEPQKDRYDWDKPLSASVPTTMFEAFLMVLHLVLRHGLGGPFIEDMLKFINTLLGETVVPVSKYLFKKLFSPKSAMSFHFYCHFCHFYLGEKTSFNVSSVSCESCGESNKVESLENANFFITLSVRSQLEDLMMKPDFKLTDRSHRQDNTVRDIFDGKLYRLLCEPGNSLADKNSLSVTFNTDGASRFKSGKSSVWPIQLYVNEVVPEDRFKSENMILGGIWFGKGSPLMSTFLKPFIAELKDLSVNGVKKIGVDGSVVVCPVYAIVASVDSIAKPKLQNIKQFNGSYGCGYCLHPNIPCAEVGNHGRYISGPADHDYPYRSHIQMEQNMLEADRLDREGKLVVAKKGTNEETLDHVLGLRGLSVLLSLPGFHIVFGFIIDYLHCLLEGVMKLVFEMFLQITVDGKKLITEEVMQKLDRRMKKLKPPQVMSRHPRPVSDRSDWNAREWRSFLLFFSVPCLQDILPQRHLDNLKYLVTASFILLKDCISHEELDVAESHLQKFVTGFNVLYGDAHMVYNVHLCTHLVKIVRLWGPLWAYSNFVFESGNGHLLKLVNGTRGVPTQICEKFMNVRMVSNYIKKYNVSERVLKFCSDVFSFQYVKRSAKVDGVTLLGSGKVPQLSEEEKLALQNGGIDWHSSIVTYFNRVIRSGVVYYSAAYEKPKVFNDTFVQLVNGSYAVLEKVFTLNGDEALWAFIKPIRISEEDHPVPHIQVCAYDMYCPLVVVPFSLVFKKSILLEVDDKHYVSNFPNIYERD